MKLKYPTHHIGAVCVVKVAKYTQTGVVAKRNLRQRVDEPCDSDVEIRGMSEISWLSPHENLVFEEGGAEFFPSRKLGLAEAEKDDYARHALKNSSLKTNEIKNSQEKIKLTRSTTP